MEREGQGQNILGVNRKTIKEEEESEKLRGEGQSERLFSAAIKDQINVGRNVAQSKGLIETNHE